MPSKPAEARSIGSQLVLRFTAAAALLLGCGLAVLYWIVIQHAFEEDNEALAEKLFAIRADLDSSGGPQLLSRELNTPRPRERVTYWVRALNSAGEIMAESPGMSALLPVATFPVAQNAVASVPKPVMVRTQKGSFALLAAREESGASTYTIQLAQDRSVDDQFGSNFGLLVVAVLAAGSVASVLIARSVTRQGLRPLGEITRSLERTGPTRLHERVEPTAWPRELRPIAIAFDQMLDRLEDSFTRLSQFSADLAHELRTPVANLRGEAEVALTRPRSPEEYREVLESSVTECERLSAIIDSLLFLARAEAAQGLAERTLFDGRAAIDKIAGFFGTIADERGVTITCRGSGEVHADALLFGRAVSNLVENALNFTGDGGEISVELKVEPAHAQISVQDNGCGIEQKHLPRIFDRFYRADTARSAQGNGLGLALVKSITDLHGGSATAESAVGRGTVMRLTFPNR